MPNLFDAKAFNAEAFNYRVERVPNLKTNELLKKNSEMLKLETIEAAKQSERPIVDIDILKQCNRELISSINEVVKIHEQGTVQRIKAQEELVKIEAELKQAMFNNGKR